MAEVLCYKPEGRDSSPVEVIEFFNLPNPSSHTMTLGFIQPRTEMSIKIYVGDKALPM
jgi:hypothetical protein